jgi:Ca2+-transporting ATPase
MNLFYSFTVINDVRSVFSLDTFGDRRFVMASIASFVAILIGAQMDVMNRLLDTRPLDRDEWIICIAASLSIIVVSEIRKLLLRRKLQA